MPSPPPTLLSASVLANIRMAVFPRKWTAEDTVRNRHAVFLYGDNEQRWGKKGQAVIRGCDNAIGIRTKARPSMDESAMWQEADKERCMQMVMEDFGQLVKYLRNNAHVNTIYISSRGVGTGLAGLPTTAPSVHAFICGIFVGMGFRMNGSEWQNV